LLAIDVLEMKMSLTSLGTTLAALNAGNCRLYLQGVVNVEGGSISASGKQFGFCEECEIIDFERLFFMDCKACGRNRDNFFWINSGDGDGMYLVFLIVQEREDDSDLLDTLGFVVLFDSNYDFSKPSMEETIEDGLPQYTIEFLDPFAKLESFDVGTFSDLKYLYISDALKDTDASDAQIHIHLDGEVPSVVVKAFSEKPGEGTGPFPNLDSPRARVLIGMNSRVSDDYLTGSKIAIENEAQVLSEWLFTGMSASHQERMDQVAIWYNYMLHNAIGDANQAVSWLMQGALHDDSDCKQKLKEYDLVDVDETLSRLLIERGMITAAQDVLKNKNFISQVIG